MPDEVTAAPAAAVAQVAEQLELDPRVLQGYGKRVHTRIDHLAPAAKYLGWKSAAAGSTVMKELEQFLLDRAMEHDSPTLLFDLAREHLLAAKVIRPGPIVLAKTIGSARKGAGDLTSHLLAPMLTGQLRADLERMLLVEAGLGMTRLGWLNSPARNASASAVKISIEKLAWFRGIDAHQLGLSMLPNERRRFLATVARRSTNQGVARRGDRKFPILPVLADPSIPDEQVGGIVRDRIGMQMLQELNTDTWTPLSKDRGRLSELDSSYTYLRQFTPNVLAAIDFRGGPGTSALMQAVAVLEELNRVGGRKVPLRRADRIHPGQVHRLPGQGPQVRGRHRLPALLGTVRDLVPSGRAPLRRRMGAGVAPVCRLGHRIPGLAQ
nr:DUF4158 domain-containing protein [Nocardia brevicatena]